MVSLARGELQGGGDVSRFEIWIILEDFLAGGTRCEEVEDECLVKQDCAIGCYRSRTPLPVIDGKAEGAAYGPAGRASMIRCSGGERAGSAFSTAGSTCSDGTSVRQHHMPSCTLWPVSYLAT